MPKARARRSKSGDLGVRAIRSTSASIRLQEARTFLGAFSAGTEVLLLGASRGAVDDLARMIAMEKGATFGLHRLTFTQLAARLAATNLTAHGRAPASALGHEAVAARAVFEASTDEVLDYFSPVSRMPGFPKALARTLQDLRLGGIAASPLSRLLRSGPDLADLMDRVDTSLGAAGAGDRASLFDEAIKALESPGAGWQTMPVLLLDVPFESDTEARFLWALVDRSPSALLTIPTGDSRAAVQIQKRGITLESAEHDGETDLTRLSRHLFSVDPPLSENPQVSWSGSRRQARGANVWRSRAGFLRKPPAAFASMRWPFSCARRSNTWACLSTHWPEPGFRRASIEASGARTRPAGRSWRC